MKEACLMAVSTLSTPVTTFLARTLRKGRPSLPGNAGNPLPASFPRAGCFQPAEARGDDLTKLLISTEVRFSAGTRVRQNVSRQCGREP